MAARSSKLSRAASSSSKTSVWAYVAILVLSNVLVFQLSRQPLQFGTPSSESSFTDFLSALPSLQQQSKAVADWDPLLNPLGIPPGQAQNLPSVRVEEADVDKYRTKNTNYGGFGDKMWLGGFTDYDGDGVSPHLWKNMMQKLGVRSVLDVGCGRGTSTTWFLKQGADVLCVEGSHDAVQQTLLPDPATQVVEHDFARGPWWPEKTYDAVWSVEFLEHVSRQYHYNYVTSFRKAALLFVTSSRWGGWHHVEVHPDEWWIRKMTSYGFQYDAELTKMVKGWARQEANNETAISPSGKRYRAYHVIMSMKVFINPAVMALPQHQHLFPREGCFKDWNNKEGKIYNKPCDAKEMETVLPSSFQPLPFNEAGHREWEGMILANAGNNTKG